jgi:autotransporter translocation and assembly factor TamB
MAQLKLKQVLSNLSYNDATDQLTLSGSANPSLIVSGSIMVTSTPNISGSLTINGYDTFGDDTTPTIIDLGTY